MERLLMEADEAFGALQLTTPKSDNAFDRYTQVLELEPGNSKARQGIKRIAEKYVDLATIRIDNEDAIKAESYLDKAAEIDPDLDGLKEARQALAELTAPRTISILDFRLFNAAEGGKRIGSDSNSFPKDEIRYIYFELTYSNNTGREGSIGVKYIRPDGVVDRGKDSPAGLTLKFDARPGESEHSSGWGNADESTYAPGTHRIEFWWKNKKLGEKTFFVR